MGKCCVLQFYETKSPLCNFDHGLWQFVPSARSTFHDIFRVMSIGLQVCVMGLLFIATRVFLNNSWSFLSHFCFPHPSTKVVFFAFFFTFSLPPRLLSLCFFSLSPFHQGCFLCVFFSLSPFHQGCFLCVFFSLSPLHLHTHI